MGLGVGARKNRTFSTYRVRRMLEALWDKLIPKKKKERERERNRKRPGKTGGCELDENLAMVEELFRQISKFTFIHSTEVSPLPTSTERYKQDDEQDQSLLQRHRGRKRTHKK